MYVCVCACAYSVCVVLRPPSLTIVMWWYVHIRISYTTLESGIN